MHSLPYPGSGSSTPSVLSWWVHLYHSCGVQWIIYCMHDKSDGRKDMKPFPVTWEDLTLCQELLSLENVIQLLLRFSSFDSWLSSYDVCCSCIHWFLNTVLCSEDEERLVRDLFRDYNKLIRPVETMNETVVVTFGLNFIQLINIVRDTLSYSISLLFRLSKCITLEECLSLWTSWWNCVCVRERQKNTKQRN